MLRSFWKDRRGNFAMMTAVTAVPLLGGLALGIDYSEMTRQKQTLQSALDAAGIAAAKRIAEGADDKAVKTYALDFLKTNLVGIDTTSLQLDVVLPTSSTGGGKLTLTGGLTYKPFFMEGFITLLGEAHTAVKLAASSEVRLKNTLEVALVLDNSGSMDYKGKNSSKKRMELLKAAAKQLVKDMSAHGSALKQVSKPVQFSVVPFAASVNVGPSNRNAAWMDTSGVSPIHHENFNWDSIKTANRYTEVTVDGSRLARGSDWGPLKDSVLTRFTLYDNLKRVLSATWKPNLVCTNKNLAGICLSLEDKGAYEYVFGSTASWAGCVEARPSPYNTDDTAPSAAAASTLFVPMFAPDETDQRSGGNYAYNSWLLDEGLVSGFENSASVRQRSMMKYFTPAPLGFNGALASIFGMDQGPNLSCTTTPITPLTDVTTTAGMDTINKAIDDMESGGATNVPEGMAWGWRALSSAAPFTGGRAEKEKGNDKVVIVLTDGANTYYTPGSLGANDLAANKSIYSAYGYTGQGYNGTNTTRMFEDAEKATKTDFDNGNYTKALNDVFTKLCGNSAFMRLSADKTTRTGNVIVMTVALDLNAGNPTEASQIEALKSCASPSRITKEKPLFWNATGGALDTVFKEIADELSNLRIVG